MIAASADLKIYVATRPIDFRCGHDGLATKVQEMLHLDPFSGAAFVFRSKRADRIKILVWDRTGLVLVHKRLEGCKFVWPTIADGVMRISPAMFAALFEGLASNDTGPVTQDVLAGHIPLGITDTPSALAIIRGERRRRPARSRQHHPRALADGSRAQQRSGSARVRHDQYFSSGRPDATRADVLAAMEGHVLASGQLMGRYHR